MREFGYENPRSSLENQKAVVVIKHTNPCGASSEKNQLKSFNAALLCDPISAYGGIVAINSIVSKKLAKKLNGFFFEIILSRGFKKDAL